MTPHPNTKHGNFRNGKSWPLYDCWRHMLRRCNNPKDRAFKNYGGRGIKVCRRWHSFGNFLEDMGSAWEPGLTLERMDNNRGYLPGNCRWANYKEQENNRNNNVRISFDGLTLTMAQWAERLGMKRLTLVNRLTTLKWPVEKALKKSVAKPRGIYVSRQHV